MSEEEKRKVDDESDNQSHLQVISGRTPSNVPTVVDQHVGENGFKKDQLEGTPLDLSTDGDQHVGEDSFKLGPTVAKHGKFRKSTRKKRKADEKSDKVISGRTPSNVPTVVDQHVGEDGFKKDQLEGTPLDLSTDGDQHVGEDGFKKDQLEGTPLDLSTDGDQHAGEANFIPAIVKAPRKTRAEKEKERRAKVLVNNPVAALISMQQDAERKRKTRLELKRKDPVAALKANQKNAKRNREKKQELEMEDPSAALAAKQDKTAKQKERRAKRRQASSTVVNESNTASAMTPVQATTSNAPTCRYNHNSSPAASCALGIETPMKPVDEERRETCRRVLFLSDDEQQQCSTAYRSKWLTHLSKYFESIRKGPTWICSCCGGLFYRKGVYNIDKQKLQQWGLTKPEISSILFVDQENHTLCMTCYNTSRKKKVPTLALSNGLDFPEVPHELKNLTRLEHRLISPRLPFMQIKLLGFEQQWTLKGNVVNVENDVNTCVKSLPRQFRDASVVQLRLMRRMIYNRPYIYDKICPAKLIAAVKYLLNTPLYKNDGVTLSDNWDRFINLDHVDFNEEIDDTCTSSSDCHPQEENETIDEILEDHEDNGTVDDEQTLLFEEDALGITISPAEGNKPKPLHLDPHAELLSFPTIYCGQPRSLKENSKLSYTSIVKSELRRYDRRCATPEKILFSFKKSYNEKVRDAYQICVRQKPASFRGKDITAGMLKNDASVQTLLAKDDGYAVYKNVRCTPAYWKEQCKKVVAMIRQLGPCSFFITLSAAEAKWPELLVMLSKLVDGKTITEEEALKLSSQERARLVRSDPVTCMRHFDNRFRELLNRLLKSDTGVFEPRELLDWYIRIEFQLRGSPHVHGLFWYKNAPLFVVTNEDSWKMCVEFIDKFITCKRDDEGEMKDLIGYQLHRHSHTCKKGKRCSRTCRFHYPQHHIKN